MFFFSSNDQGEAAVSRRLYRLVRTYCHSVNNGISLVR